MFRQIKKELLQNPQSVINILEEFGFSDLRIHNNEIRCGLSEGHNATAIRIRLINNDNLFVNDFVRGLSYDLINFFCEQQKQLKQKPTDNRILYNTNKPLTKISGFKYMQGTFKYGSPFLYI